MQLQPSADPQAAAITPRSLARAGRAIAADPGEHAHEAGLGLRVDRLQHLGRPRRRELRGDRRAQPVVPQVLVDLDDGFVVSAPVGSFAPNSLGFFDMGGNVAEWTDDLYTVQPPASAAAVDPVATGEGSIYVLRGSSWKHSSVTELRLSFRDYGNGRRNDIGFRIARYAQ